MCQIMEDYGDKREKRGFEKGFTLGYELVRKQQSIEFANELWNDGIRDLEKISRLSKLPLDEVKKLFEGRTA